MRRQGRVPSDHVLSFFEPERQNPFSTENCTLPGTVVPPQGFCGARWVLRTRREGPPSARERERRQGAWYRSNRPIGDWLPTGDHLGSAAQIVYVWLNFFLQGCSRVMTRPASWVRRSSKNRGSAQEVFEISRAGSGRVGSGQMPRPMPTREKPCFFGASISQ